MPKKNLDMLPDIRPAILAGGAGKRLWPLTSKDRPKPLLKIGKHSLLGNIKIRNESYLNLICVSSREYSGIKTIIEPAARSTAPAIALAATTLPADSIMLVQPCDHWIEDAQGFQDITAKAAQIAAAEDIPVLIGAPARTASTRYGYIACNAQGHVQRFIEKPDSAAAKALIREPHIFWNTGIFAVKVSVLLDLFRRHAPDILAAIERDYKSARAISIDYAIMEQLKRAKLLPLPGYWSDVGTWPSFLNAHLRHHFIHKGKI